LSWLNYPWHPENPQTQKAKIKKASVPPDIFSPQFFSLGYVEDFREGLDVFFYVGRTHLLC
jgi:hypothetical protein